MNINLIKFRLSQNSKKCNKFLYNLLYNDGFVSVQTLRRCSTTSHWFNRHMTGQISMISRTPRRCYCQENEPSTGSQKLPPLMDVEMAVWPSLFKSIKNGILSTFIIKPYFDNDFSLPDFIQGSKKAAEVVSHKLANGEDLEGLVTPDIISKLKEKVSGMTLVQRDLIPIEAQDIYFAFPFQIGVMFNQEEVESQKRFVEITMVYHVLRGLSAMRERGEEPPLNLGLMPEYQEKLSICNYRFIKEFTKGVESDWTVNLLNHYRPVDEVE